MTTQCVQLRLELGHKASVRAKKTPEGFTHDWTVYIKGPEGSSIQHFVEKVIFHLHDTFPKPKRVIKEPPYQVSECGYAGFIIPIEVHFKSKDKVMYDYDLFLQPLIQTQPVHRTRFEKLTFNNPTEDFRRKLIKAGGVGILGGHDTGTVLNQQQKPSPRSSSPTNSVHPASGSSKTVKHVSEAIKAPKSATSSSSQVSSGRGPTPPVTSSSYATKEPKTVSHLQPPQTFVDLFGQPIKTSKSSPDPQKNKDAHAPKNSKKSSKTMPGGGSDEGGSSKSVASGDTKEGKSRLSKEGKSYPRDKISNKRALSPPLSPIGESGAVTKRRKRNPSSSSSSNASKSKEEENRKLVKKGTFSDIERRENNKSGSSRDKCSPASVSSGANETRPTNKVKSSSSSSHASKDGGNGLVRRPDHHKSKRRVSSSATSPSNSSPGSEPKVRSKRSVTTSSSSRVSPTSPPRPPSPAPEDEPAAGGSSGRVSDEEDASPSSSISFSSVRLGKGSGTLGALMAELDDEQALSLSPMSSDSCPSPPQNRRSSSPPRVPPLHQHRSHQNKVDDRTLPTTKKKKPRNGRPPSPPSPPPPAVSPPRSRSSSPHSPPPSSRSPSPSPRGPRSPSPQSASPAVSHRSSSAGSRRSPSPPPPPPAPSSLGRSREADGRPAKSDASSKRKDINPPVKVKSEKVRSREHVTVKGVEEKGKSKDDHAKSINEKVKIKQECAKIDEKVKVREETGSSRDAKSRGVQEKGKTVEGKATKLEDEKKRARESEDKIRENKVKSKEDRARIKEDKAKIKEDRAKDKAKIREDKAKIKEDKAKIKEDKAKIREDKAKIRDDKATKEKDGNALNKTKGKDPKPLKKSNDCVSVKEERQVPASQSLKKERKEMISAPVLTETASSRSVITEDYVEELQQLQSQIMALRDGKYLQKVIDVIEETGLYEVTSSTFDFDLCSLDRVTVRKLKKCLAAVVL